MSVASGEDKEMHHGQRVSHPLYLSRDLEDSERDMKISSRQEGMCPREARRRAAAALSGTKLSARPVDEPSARPLKMR